MNVVELGKILKDMYDNAPDKDKVAMIHLFGIKYAESISTHPTTEIIKASGISESYTTEVNKGLRLSRYVKPISDMSKDEANSLSDEVDSLSDVAKNSIPEEISRNKIVYGAPGTGKSFEIERDIRIKYFNDDNLNTRITFNKNYSYSQFLGSYKPSPIYSRYIGDAEEEYYSVDKQNKLSHQMKPIIDYEVVPGPFLEILCRALSNPRHNFLLILEEINRADAAAVFGDVFQLLDRDDDGNSQYKVRFNKEIMNYIYNCVQDENECFKKGSFVKIPKNLYIWATMNSADQGVSKIDAAFQRRWSYGFVSIDKYANEIKNSEYEVKLKISEEVEYKIEWYRLRDSINNILKMNNITEDKLLGPFFLRKEELKNPDDFKFKLLLYLRDNVLRHNWNKLFIKNIFSDIINDFDKGNDIFKTDIGIEGIYITKNDSGGEERKDE